MKKFLVTWTGTRESRIESGEREVEAVSAVCACFRVQEWMKLEGIKPLRLSPQLAA